MPHPLSGAPAARRSRAKRVWLAMGAVAVIAAGAAVLSLGSGTDAGGAPTKITSKPVRAQQARTATIPLLSEYRGELVANVAELAAQATGRVVEIKADIGDAVKKGELLVKVDAAETRRLYAEAVAQVRHAEANVQRVEAELAAAQLEAERGRNLAETQLLSEQQKQQLESRVEVLQADLSAANAGRAAASARVSLYQEQLSQAEIRAPFDGAIAERHLDPGSMVQPTTPILRLVQSGPMRVRFRVSERHLARLSTGATIEVTTLATGETRYPGSVERISAEVSRIDRTIAVEGVLGDAPEQLRPGMYATVRVQLGTVHDATLVPATAVMEGTDDTGAPTHSVFTVEAGRAERHQVTVAGKHEDEVAVEGIPQQAQVIVFGQETVRSGDAVRVVNSGGT